MRKMIFNHKNLKFSDNNLGLQRFHDDVLTLNKTAFFSNEDAANYAAHILKCVNLHDELIKSINEEFDMFEAMPGHFKVEGSGNWIRWKNLDNLLKRAKGEN